MRRWLLHPWGVQPKVAERAGVPAWCVAAAADLDMALLRAPVPAAELAVGPPAPFGASPENLAHWYRPIVVKVVASVAGVPSSNGTGVFVSGDGLVLTCAHVLLGDQIHVEVVGSGQRYKATAVFVNQQSDVALLKIDGFRSDRWATVDLDDDPAQGHDVIAIGHGVLEEEATRGTSVSRGLVAGTTDGGEGHRLTLDITVSSGTSGGPVISLQSGHVVGVVQSVALRPGTVNGVSSSGFVSYAAPSSRLDDWLGLTYR